MSFIDELNKNNFLLDDSTEYSLSAAELKKHILFFSSILEKTGVKSGDKICLFAENHPKYVIFEQAILNTGGICVPRGSKNPVSELEYIYINSDSNGIITDSIEIASYFISLDKSGTINLNFIFYYGNEENLLPQSNKILKYSGFDLSKDIAESDILSENKEDSPAFILYTSGTSGFPKGVVLKKSSINHQIEALKERVKINSGKTFLCLHPLWHSGPRIYNMLFLSSGCNVVYTSFKNYIESIKKYSPDYLHSVPKAVYAIYDEYKKNLSKSNILYKSIFKLFFSMSLKYRKSVRILKSQSAILPEINFVDYLSAFIFAFTLYFAHIFAKKIFYVNFRRKILKDNVIIFTGAAKLSDYVQDWFDVFGVKILGGYGLTETSPLLTHDNLANQKYYSAGFPLKDTEVKIVNPETFEDIGKNKIGMIIAKGPQVMVGYYNNKSATDSIMLPDGFLITGDLGWLTKDNHIVIISRYDDTIVLSNGSNVSTLCIEEECLKSPFVNQIVLVGHSRLYISALCHINENEYLNWCKNNKMSESSVNKNQEFKNYFLSHLNEIISKRKNFVPYEKIKDVFFVSEPFSAENNLMTNTSKLRRNEINKYYNNQIDVLYNSSSGKF